MALMARRLVQLYVGLAFYGLGIALQVSSGLGNGPWDVLHEGLSRRLGLSIGAWVVITGALVMLAWIPLRQRPGIGTISNAVLIGVFADLFLWLLPDPGGPRRAAGRTSSPPCWSAGSPPAATSARGSGRARATG